MKKKQSKAFTKYGKAKLIEIAQRLGSSNKRLRHRMKKTKNENIKLNNSLAIRTAEAMTYQRHLSQNTFKRILYAIKYKYSPIKLINKNDENR